MLQKNKSDNESVMLMQLNFLKRKESAELI